MIKEFDYVILRDGTKGTVADMKGNEFYLDNGEALLFCHVSDVLAVWDDTTETFTALLSATRPVKKFSTS